MKRLPRDAEQLDTMRLLDMLGRREGVPLSSSSSDKIFLDNGFGNLRKNPILVQGHRTEKMFGFVAASLGACMAIKEEDSGEVYALDANIQPPDYKLALKTGRVLYVEVKNCHKTTGHFLIKESYLEELRAYCQKFPGDLRLAVYWSRWNKWTLLDPARIPLGKKMRAIGLGDAMKINEMGTLGDIFPGTRTPLVFRILTDPQKPRVVGNNGQVEFTIGSVELHCAGRKIEDRKEQSLAFYFMLFGGWNSEAPRAKIEAGQLHAIDFVAEPEESAPNQNFQILDPLSSMISRRYRTLTSDETGIARLAPKQEPGSLGVVIPDGYKGKDLPLWRFTLVPNSKPLAPDSPT